MAIMSMCRSFSFVSTSSTACDPLGTLAVEADVVPTPETEFPKELIEEEYLEEELIEEVFSEDVFIEEALIEEVPLEEDVAVDTSKTFSSHDIAFKISSAEVTSPATLSCIRRLQPTE